MSMLVIISQLLLLENFTPHFGHRVLIQKVADIAEEVGGTPFIFTSTSKTLLLNHILKYLKNYKLCVRCL